jgi:hypothetical protein
VIFSVYEEAEKGNYPAGYLTTVQAALADLEDGVVYAMDAARDYELIYVQGRIWGASSSASAFFDQSPEGDVWFEPVCHLAHISGAFTDYKIASRPNHAAEENRNLSGRKHLQFQQGFKCSRMMFQNLTGPVEEKKCGGRVITGATAGNRSDGRLVVTVLRLSLLLVGITRLRAASRSADANRWPGTRLLWRDILGFLLMVDVQ